VSSHRRASAALVAVVAAGSACASLLGWRPRHAELPRPPFAVTGLHAVAGEEGPTLWVALRSGRPWTMGVEVWCEFAGVEGRVRLPSTTVRLKPEVDPLVVVPLPGPNRGAHAVSVYAREAPLHFDARGADPGNLLFTLRCDYGGAPTPWCPPWPRR
jgi:hypothetical protein